MKKTYYQIEKGLEQVTVDFEDGHQLKFLNGVLQMNDERFLRDFFDLQSRNSKALNRECPKCGYEEAAIRHNKSMDYMELKCTICQYEWNLPPIDRKG